MSLIFPFYGDGFFASLHLYILIAKRPSFTILPDVHQISGLHVWPVFRRNKCGDGNRCSVGFLGEEGCCFLSQMDDKL